MIKAIVFDCYGVLLGNGYWNVCKKFSNNIEEDRKFIASLLDKVNLGIISSDELHSSTAQRLGMTKENWIALIRADEKPNKEIFDFINKSLKNKYKIGLLSNGGLTSIKRKIPDDLLSLFDVIVTSVEVQLIKPDPKIFFHIAEKLEVHPNEIIFIDDIERYVEAAKTIGINGIRYENIDQLSKELLKILNFAITSK